MFSSKKWKTNLSGSWFQGEWGIRRAGEIVRDWAIGGLYPKSNAKAMNHFQQRRELTYIWKGLLCQQSGEWTKRKTRKEVGRPVRLLLHSREPRGNSDHNLRNSSRDGHTDKYKIYFRSKVALTYSWVGRGNFTRESGVRHNFHFKESYCIDGDVHVAFPEVEKHSVGKINVWTCEIWDTCQTSKLKGLVSN